MASGAGRCVGNHGYMALRRMAGHAAISRSGFCVMMDTAGWVGRNRMTGQAGRGTPGAIQCRIVG